MANLPIPALPPLVDAKELDSFTARLRRLPDQFHTLLTNPLLVINDTVDDCLIHLLNSCTLMENGLSAGQASLSWSVIREAPNTSNLAYVHHTGRFHGVRTVEITGKKLATPQGRFQLYRIVHKNVGALIVLARYGINKPDAYVDIRARLAGSRELGKGVVGETVSSDGDDEEIYESGGGNDGGRDEVESKHRERRRGTSAAAYDVGGESSV
ncbi:hypothetical protein B0H13DRAFT_1897793 [Mycena leptocephala]|nr:hypothetical protein B0H13DRAFT_1897793 [Mycena leptocephala]